MNDLVTICIPTFNGARFLAKCLDTVVNQSYQNLEILIVDDQSSDNTVEIARRFQEQDIRIKIYSNDKNLGLVGNWNRSLDIAQGEWVKLQFQDDLMSLDAIEEMLKLGSNYGVDVVLSEREYLFEDGLKDPFENLPRLSDQFKNDGIIEPLDLAEMLMQIGIGANFIGEPIIGLIKKELVTKYGGFDARLKQIVDLEYWLKLGLNERIAFTPRNLNQFRVHTNSESAKNSSMKGIRPSDIDEINVAYKLIHDPVFKPFRDRVSQEKVISMMNRRIRFQIVKNGYYRMKKEIEPQIFNSCSMDWLSRTRAFTNDLIKRN